MTAASCSTAHLHRGLALCLILAAAPHATAQVHGPGPSDPSLFDTVINLPPDPDFGDDASVGGVDSETTQLNVLDGGSINDGFNANSGSEVNISGGLIGEDFHANSGAEVNISGGTIDNDLSARSGSVVNISGGTIGSRFRVSSDSEVNISGGTVRSYFAAFSGSVIDISGGTFGLGSQMQYGSVVNISGGIFGRDFSAFSGSDVSISGGTFGAEFSAHPGSDVELIGGEFVLNGVAYTGGAITLAEGDVFSGALADGSAFILTPLASDELSNVTLTRVTLPAPALEPIVIDGASTAAPAGLRAGQTLTVVEGGAIGGNFEAVGATVNVAGGVVGEYSGRVAFAHSVVNVTDGRIRAVMNAYDGSEVNLSGGEMGIAHSYNSVVNLSGNSRAGYYEGHSGSVLNLGGQGFFRGVRGHAGSEVNMGGGNIAEYLHVAGSVVNISGGTVDYSLKTGEDSEVNMSGGRVDGSFVAEWRSVANISGTSYIHSLSADPGTEVNISGRSVVDNFTAKSSQVTIRGGTFGAGFYSDYWSDTEFIGGDFMLDGVAYTGDTVSSGGVFTGTFADGSAFIFSSDVGDHLRDVTLTRVALPDADTEPIIIDATSPPPPAGLRAGQTLTLLEGGVVPNHFEAVDATLSILGGTFGHGGAAARSRVDISGGALGDSFAAYSGSVVNISGGSIGAAFHAYSGSELNLVGTAFALNGTRLNSLDIGAPMLITSRDVTLSGMLADGSSFSFDLNSTRATLEDYFSPNATLTITLVPTGLPGDYNNDGLVDAADYTVWRDNVGAEAGALPNDPDGGVIGDAQLQTWRASYAASLVAAASEPSATPEPAGVLLALLAMGLATTRRARR